MTFLFLTLLFLLEYLTKFQGFIYCSYLMISNSFIISSLVLSSEYRSIVSHWLLDISTECLICTTHATCQSWICYYSLQAYRLHLSQQCCCLPCGLSLESWCHFSTPRFCSHPCSGNMMSCWPILPPRYFLHLSPLLLGWFWTCALTGT